MGSTGAATCTTCDLGKYVNVEGSDEPSDCQDCDAGATINADSTACEDCASGKYNSVAGQDCIGCGQGKASTATGKLLAQTCEPCVAGKSTVGTEGNVEFTKCPAEHRRRPQATLTAPTALPERTPAQLTPEKRNTSSRTLAQWEHYFNGLHSVSSHIILSDDGRHTQNSACECRSRGRRGAPRGASPRPLGETTAQYHANAVVTRNERGDSMLRGIEHVLVRTHKELRLGRKSRLH